ncbi:MAG: GTP-dependent dephospho-CoA kinase family protein [Haloferacaceae archaeon]
MLRLPDSLRDAFKEPLGPVYADAGALLADAGEPVVSVGDVVTYHLRTAGHEPAVAVVDARTERRPVDEEIRRVAVDDADRTVTNESGTLSRDLLVALRAAVDAADPVVIRVEGEEDLAALPAILAVPDGGSVVYGQPGEGMVLVVVDREARDRARALLGRMAGDAEAAIALVSRTGA